MKPSRKPSQAQRLLTAYRVLQDLPGAGWGWRWKEEDRIQRDAMLAKIGLKLKSHGWIHVEGSGWYRRKNIESLRRLTSL